MAELFWRTKLKRRANNVLGLMPSLPTDIDDNVFIALGTQAAEADKLSKAYDEFLFSEDGYEQMPYEDSVDEILNLQKSRNVERRARSELPLKMRIEYLAHLVEAKKLKLIERENKLEQNKNDILSELAILSGSNPGEESGNWEGVAADTTSRTKHIVNNFKEWLVFALVAGADATIVFFTIFSLLKKVDESLMFSAPAIGVQILFPHLTGKAIASYRANREKNSHEFWVGLGIGLSWFAYVLAMSILRFQLLQENYGAANPNNSVMPVLLQFASYTFTFLILIGLGAWVLIRAMRTNPHKQKLSRLTYVQFGLKNSIRRSSSRLRRLQAKLQWEMDNLAVVSSQWALREASYDRVSESAKSVYRRALVNHLGTPEFTTEYLPETKFKVKKNFKVGK